MSNGLLTAKTLATAKARDGPFGRDADGVHLARHLLHTALRSKYPWSKAEGVRIAAILERAAADIIRAETKAED